VNNTLKTRDKKPWSFCYSLTKCRVARQSQAALLVSRDGKNFWVPKSVIHESSQLKTPGDSGVLIVMLWFAFSEKGLNLNARSRQNTTV
jgi:hypothetical protein